MLTQSMARVFAYDYFIEALQFYQKAEKVRPEHNDEAILRWNSCIRTIETEGLKPRPEHKDARQDMES
jgi:hypothetical protein